MANGYFRIAREASGGPGNESTTATLATKRVFIPILDFDPNPGTTHLRRNDELRNSNLNPSVVPESYTPDFSFRTRLYPDVFAQLLTCIFGTPTTAAGDGIITDLAGTIIPATGTPQRHRWTDDPAGTSPTTFQFDAGYTELGSPVYFVGRGAAITELSVEAQDEGGVLVSVSGIAAYMDEQSNPSLTPTYESLAIKPMMRRGLDIVTNLAGAGEIADFTLSISNPVEHHSGMVANSMWPDVVEFGDEGLVLTSGSMPRRILDSTDIAALKNATGFALVASYASQSVIGDSYPYKFNVSCANAQLVSGKPGALGNRRRIGMDDVGWESTTADGTTCTTFEVVNTTTSYA